MTDALPRVEIFTDGACSGNPGPGGYGVILRFNGKEKELTGGASETTNNRMELTAAIEEKVGLQLAAEGMGPGKKRTSPQYRPLEKASGAAGKAPGDLLLGKGPCGAPGKPALRPDGGGPNGAVPPLTRLFL